MIFWYAYMYKPPPCKHYRITRVIPIDSKVGAKDARPGLASFAPLQGSIVCREVDLC